MKAKFKNSTSIERTKPSVGGRRETVKVSDQVEMLDWPKGGKSIAIRPVGPLAARGIHKIKVRKKDGTEVEIQKACLAFDPATDEKDSTKKCPYCKMPAELAKFSKLYFINAIVRPLQEDKPNKLKKITKEEDETGFKSMDSDSWTPVRVVRVPSSLALRFKQLGDKNVVKNKTGDKKAFPVMHEKYGFDLDVSFDKNLPAANMYSADRAEGPEGGRYSPLTEEEDGYLLWDTDPLYAPEDFEEAKKEAEAVAEKLNGQVFVVIRSASDAGALYGSVSPRDAAEAATAAGFTVKRDQVELDKPIKDLGIHSVTVVLHPEVAATIKLNVARSVEEAELQASGKSIQELAAEAEAAAEFEIAELFDEVGAAASEV